MQSQPPRLPCLCTGGRGGKEWEEEEEYEKEEEEEEEWVLSLSFLALSPPGLALTTLFPHSPPHPTPPSPHPLPSTTTSRERETESLHPRCAEISVMAGDAVTASAGEQKEWRQG